MLTIKLPALLGHSLTSYHLVSEELPSDPSIISLLFQGEHNQVITCKNCHYESVSIEPFTILSLSLPGSGNCTLEMLLSNNYETGLIDYTCTSCNKVGKCARKTVIQRLPPVLVLHLNRFEYNISARKKQNYVDFPLQNLSLKEHVQNNANLPLYNLCAVSNHYGTLSGGHYTCYCKPSHENIWYQCDDKNVTKLKTSIKSSAAYLLFYVSP